VVTSLCESILFDRHQVRPVSHWQPLVQCCISSPVVIGRQGVIAPMHTTLNKDENAKMDRSAGVLRSVIAQQISNRASKLESGGEERAGEIKRRNSEEY
jgi:malate/lactate dehydrogenase